MKLWKRAGSVGLSLVLCAGLVLPALAHTVTIDGGDTQQVDTVQEGVDAIAGSGSGSGTITMTGDETTGSVMIHGGDVTLDLSGHTLTHIGPAAIHVSGGELTLKDSGTGGTVSGIEVGVWVGGGKAEITGGTVSGIGTGVHVYNGTAEITGGTVSGGIEGVYVYGGKAEITDGTVSGKLEGVVVQDGTAAISGGDISGGRTGVYVGGGTAAISGGAVSGEDKGVVVEQGGTATLSGNAAVTGEMGAYVDGGTFTMNGGTVGTTVDNGMAVVEGSQNGGTITLNGGTLYGKVSDGVNTDNVTVKDGPYDPSRPDPVPDPGPTPAPDPLTRPAAARTLLEELFRRAGGSGDLWSWAVENGFMDEDGDGSEIVTVALLRAILTRYAEAFGGNAVAVEELTTLTGEDADVVDNCRAVLNEFFGE